MNKKTNYKKKTNEELAKNLFDDIWSQFGPFSRHSNLLMEIVDRLMKKKTTWILKTKYGEGKEIKSLEELEDFRGGKAKYISGIPPHDLDPVGLVYIEKEKRKEDHIAKKGFYYPGVFSLKWVKECK
jgi:RNA-splicing ligase RtcB